MPERARIRILALDVGSKTVGVAVSDELGLTAQPVGTVRRRGLDADVGEVAAIADRYSATEVVVGLPVRTDGTEGDSARRSRRFGEALAAARPTLPVAYADERFTTVIAERALIGGGMRRERRREVIDTVAAQVLLQDWLDSRRRREAAGGSGGARRGEGG